MRHLPFIGLLLAVALAPLPLGSNRPGPWSLLAIWIGLMLIGWGLLLWRDWMQMHVRPRFWRVPALAFAAVIGWALLQSLPWTPGFLHHWTWSESASLLGMPAGGAISAAPLETLTGITRLVTYAGIFFLAMQFGRQRGAAQVLVSAVILSATCYAVYGLLVTFSGNQTVLWFAKWAYPDSLTSTFVNRNSFAAYCGIALVSLTASLLAQFRSPRATLFGDERETGDRWLARLAIQLAAVLILLTALFLTQSRGGLAATLAGLGVVAILHFGPAPRSDVAGSSRLWVLLIGLAVVTVALISGGAMMDRLSEGSAMTGRTAIWERSLVALADAPIRGHGLGAYEAVFSAYQDEPHVFAYPVDKAHNTYLELLVELGIPFGLLLIAIPFWINWRILQGRNAGLGGRYAIMALGSSTVLAAHGLVDFSAQIPAIAVVWMALLGVGFAQALSAGTSSATYVRHSAENETRTETHG